MKFTKMVPVEYDVYFLKAEMEVRYWEDGIVNGVQDDDDDPKIPLRKGDMWLLEIHLYDGSIRDWPVGTTAKVHYKVCDAGVYHLLDADHQVVITQTGYVPSMLAPQGGGYGDYVILDIDADGIIKGWKRDLRYFNNEN